MTGPQCVRGDCVEAMRAMAEGSVDAVVADPPYGLGFMGRSWDHFDAPGGAAGLLAGATGRAHGRGLQGNIAGDFESWCSQWATEALRVLKPGGHLLAFGGTRTFHRLACAVEDAGFEIRDDIAVFFSADAEAAAFFDSLNDAQRGALLRLIDQGKFNGALAWLHGQGFPKSLNVAKAIDATVGAAGSLGGPRSAEHAKKIEHGWQRPWMSDPEAVEASRRVYIPASSAGQAYHGWGTGLKPGWEPIILARKPLGERTVASNVLAHGTGALNVDGCRLEFADDPDELAVKHKNRHGDFGSGPRGNAVFGADARPRADAGNYDATGRWPANVVLLHAEGCERVGAKRVASDMHHPASRGPGGISTAGHRGEEGLEERSTAAEVVEDWRCAEGCPVRLLDEQSGERPSAFRGRPDVAAKYAGTASRSDGTGWSSPAGLSRADTGGASRFFYTAKAETEERWAWCEACAVAVAGDQRDWHVGRRHALVLHPTQKSVDLMRWLVRLVTPPGGVVLDPFMGAGSTGVAALAEGVEFVGVERDEAYFLIAEARLAAEAAQGRLFT